MSQTETAAQSSAARIAELNDLCRKGVGTTLRLTKTRGIAALPIGEQMGILQKVVSFNAFEDGDDPYGERDFGAFTHNEERILWKIDYYDPTLERGGEDPADPTRRCGCSPSCWTRNTEPCRTGAKAGRPKPGLPALSGDRVRQHAGSLEGASFYHQGTVAVTPRAPSGVWALRRIHWLKHEREDHGGERTPRGDGSVPLGSCQPGFNHRGGDRAVPRLTPQTSDFACRKWKGTALRLVLSDLKTVTRCLVDVAAPRNTQTLVVLAINESGLGQQLDSFNYGFAGADAAKRLEEGVNDVVRAATELLGLITVLRAGNVALSD